MNQNPSGKSHRIASIDILRGIIMIIMALDHTRDFFHIDAVLQNPTNLQTTTPALFFTRWITHFCAPVFLFLSGLSAFISGQRKTKTELSNFLIKRGVWLIIVEVLIVSLILTFNPLYNFFFLLVFWAIGWGMIILGLLVRSSYATIVVIGIILFFGHNILDYVSLPREGAGAVMWQLFFTTSGSLYNLGAGRFALAGYAILPWTGIMLMGYTAGYLFKNDFDSAKRKKILLRSGIALIALFIILRFINEYGDPSHWSVQKNNLYTFLSFMNVTKSPVSLQYACITLGPALILLSMLENVSNRFTNFAMIYGKVSFFYFLAHFLLIHTLCVVTFYGTGHSNSEIIDPQSLFLFRPASFGFSLGIVYFTWITVVLLMYYPSKWFGRYKQTHAEWWLSYL